MRAFLLILTIVSLVSGQFAQPVTISTTVTPWGICNADFNGDGFLDTAVIGSGDGSVNIYYGSGTGTVLRTAVLTSPGTSGHNCVTLDFNNDGKMDIITTNLISNRVSLFLNKRVGITVGSSADFNAPSDFNLAYNPQIGLIKADFNLDGLIDIAFLDNSGGVLHVWFNDRMISVTGTSFFLPGTNPASLTTGDYNADGKPDIAITIYGAGTAPGSVSVLLGNGAVPIGSGSFAAGTSYSVGVGCYGIGTGDFNSDGKPDLIVMNTAGVSPTISFLPGTGLTVGTFGTAVSIAVNNFLIDLVVGDYNSDGKLDLAAINGDVNSISVGSPSNMTVLLGNGAGGFTTGSVYSGVRPRSIASGEYNGDGKLDIVLTNTASNSWSLFLSTSSGPITPNTTKTSATLNMVSYLVLILVASFSILF